MNLQNPRLMAMYFGIFVLIIDALTKFLTQHSIPLMSSESLWYPYQGIGVFQNFGGIEFSIVHATNKGAAWSSFADYQIVLLMLRLVLIGGLIVYTFINRNQAYQIPLSLIVAGAVGNVIDYFFYGHVIDMFHFVFWGYNYPVFNIADSAIVIGVMWLFILNVKKKELRTTRQKAR